MVTMNFKKDTIDYEEFLKLAEKMTSEQYGEDSDYRSFQDVLDDHEYIPPAKETRPIDPSSNSDLTKVKRDQIKEALTKTGNVTIGNFVLKIHRYQGSIERAAKERPNEYSISLYEMKNKMPKKVQVTTDYRFKEVPWLSYFKDPIKGGSGIPGETLVDIVRWLQAIVKMGIFI